MPELPEVETVRRTLVDKITGCQIKNVDIKLPRLIKWPSAHEFKALITGRTIITLARHGKYLLLYLDNEMIVVIHLRMTGRLYYVSTADLTDQFSRIVFELSNGDHLLYADTRTLGTLYAMRPDELWRISGLASLGPEPLSPEFTKEYLAGILHKSKGKIKALLLNQKVVAGLGNIYVDEALAIAGLHPERTANSLNRAEAERLYSAINQVIADGIAHGGTTFRDYRDGAGKSGSHQNHLRVYGRKDLHCYQCGAQIVKKEVAGRGTHFCPHCQR
ncbi:DNA-formamidopyrimidine glycosylase|uniref:Formamidopyrimidine-DNA glycosylase n=1 Tax=Dendrosporobacter quercicolus TaxID=146817 RepID=A0A1G9ZJ58_9FIRM|nr:DNA-formamidopyrimidine glycosylase [Dendrosporobacter quercicolus]NSL49812.1 DNA-formamidopyrimidine glycosylase [Dendrosporobacter quercicolus DSM 1736]SDN20543.1 DNA-(apurinic or apyrimidinic site) lyase [Dendrosporobacter quercicolus]